MKTTPTHKKHQVFTFSESFKRGDLTHWSASDWYEDKESEILRALQSGKTFDTGWRGCKKEILSTCITRADNVITCVVSVSDDFDTEGMGEVTFTVQSDDKPDVILESVRTSLEQAHDAADSDKKENEVYRGYSIHNKAGQWVETYFQRWKCSD
jgi:hypothetical protein